MSNYFKNFVHFSLIPLALAGFILAELQGCSLFGSGKSDETPKVQYQFGWTKKLPGSNQDYTVGMVFDHSGNILIAGSFYGEYEIEPGSVVLNSSGDDDIFIAKYTRDGKCLFAKSFGGTKNDGATGIATDIEGNIYITGYYEGTARFDKIQLRTQSERDIFIAKLNSSGKCLWAKRANCTSRGRATSIKVDESGNAFICGYFEGKINFEKIVLKSVGEEDVFIARFNTNGSPVFAKRAGGKGRDFALSLDINRQSDIFITGAFEEHSEFSAKTLTSAGLSDIFVARYNNSGDLVWANSIGSNGYDSGNSLALDRMGNVILTGEFSGKVSFGDSSRISNGRQDIFLASINEHGKFLWSRSFGGPEIDRGLGLYPVNNNVWLTGEFSTAADFDGTKLTSAGENDVFFLRIDQDGTIPVTKQAGGTKNDMGISILADTSGVAWAAGYYSGRAKFDYEELTSVGRNIFVTKISKAILQASNK